jgi:hypothetical protein
MFRVTTLLKAAPKLETEILDPIHLGLHKKKGSDFYSLKPLSLLVGATGFEPLPGWADFIDVSERLSKTMATIKADYL